MVRSKRPAAAESADEPGELALRVLRQFRQVFNAVKTHFQMVEKRAGTRGAQCHRQPLLARAPGPFSGVLPGALAQLDPKVLRRLEADLAKLIAALGPDERAAKTPLADL